ncbi:SsrA-binding protein SmpB [Tessaracoccus sp. ZS01]|uniref:SsrA-binding protein SmpB n=1 Tax=Tessaracoccus sp. ZS01 TaxID=1906324 RepID=UPI00096E7228|nr:SsrA-binding protein SmpB [Tessaracoccus sp. ZS01]MCG6566404.1 SsrA-binding protein SmpB [Tessaracoccus sp. ZS01]OMG58865.1 SsrA-binding protein [Tessaracoccus sp. ZS01]
MPRETGKKLVAQNRKARHDYHIGDVFEAGLVLTGTEVKTLRAGRATIAEAYATVDEQGEAWLINANIPEYEFGTWRNHSARRTRKLLLHRKEIEKLSRATDDSGRTLIPLSLYFKDGYAKVEIAVATGKKDWDKRHAIAERDAQREMQRALAHRNKYNNR